jgi:parvulin-like peptidyl-prolyl isomerase
VAAAVLGLFGGHLVCNSIVCRAAIARWCGRGELLALVHGLGIYDTDLERRVQEKRIASGDDEKTESGPISMAIRSQVAAETLARYLARNEMVSRAAIEREYQLLAGQYSDEKNWTAELKANRISPRSVRRDIRENIRVECWLDRHIAPAIRVADEDCREYFERNPQAYSQPDRFRAAHLFLAAPPDTLPEIVDVKRRTIEELSARIKRGEKLADLVPLFSEDEATRKNGGDLNYFSELRMPADFMGAIGSMHVGEISGVVRTTLGFHILQLTDMKPKRLMSYDEARPEVATRLGNARRHRAIENVAAELSRQVQFLR